MRLAKTKVFIILGIFIALELLVLGLLFLNRDDNGEMAPFVYDGDYSNINIDAIVKDLEKDNALFGDFESVTVYECKENDDDMYKISLEIVSDNGSAKCTQYIIVYLKRYIKAGLKLEDYEIDEEYLPKIDFYHEIDEDEWQSIFDKIESYIWVGNIRLWDVKECTVNSLTVNPVSDTHVEVVYDVIIEAVDSDYQHVQLEGSMTMYYYVKLVRKHMGGKLQNFTADGIGVLNLPLALMTYIDSDFDILASCPDVNIEDIYSAEYLISQYIEKHEPIDVIGDNVYLTEENLRSISDNIYSQDFTGATDSYSLDCNIGIEIMEGIITHFRLDIFVDDLGKDYIFGTFHYTVYDTYEDIPGIVTDEFCGVYEGDMYVDGEVVGTIRYNIEDVYDDLKISGTVQYAPLGEDIDNAESAPFTASYKSSSLSFALDYSDQLTSPTGTALISGSIYVDPNNNELRGEKMHEYEYHMKKVASSY